VNAKTLVAGIGIVVMTTPALCAQFFIVHDAATGRCAISEQPPARGGGTVVGDGAYGDRASAEADMKTFAICTSQTTESAPRR